MCNWLPRRRVAHKTDFNHDWHDMTHLTSLADSLRLNSFWMITSQFDKIIKNLIVFNRLRFFVHTVWSVASYMYDAACSARGDLHQWASKQTKRTFCYSRFNKNSLHFIPRRRTKVMSALHNMACRSSALIDFTHYNYWQDAGTSLTKTPGQF